MRRSPPWVEMVYKAFQPMFPLHMIPDSFIPPQLAPLTSGLTLEEVAYKAQMVRTWSLLLRNARRHG